MLDAPKNYPGMINLYLKLNPTQHSEYFGTPANEAGSSLQFCSWALLFEGLDRSLFFQLSRADSGVDLDDFTVHLD